MYNLTGKPNLIKDGTMQTQDIGEAEGGRGKIIGVEKFDVYF